MRKLTEFTMLVLCFLMSLAPVFGQSRNGDPAAACGAAGCGIVVWLIMMIVIFGLAIGLIVFIVKWIGNDATSRGMPNAQSIKWLGLLGLLGLIIYLLQRAQGNTFPCPHCGKSRMQGLPQCPHCFRP